MVCVHVVNIQIGPTPRGSVPPSSEDELALSGGVRSVGGVVTLCSDVATGLSESESDKPIDVSFLGAAEMLSQGFLSHEEGEASILIRSDAQGLVPTVKDENDEVT